LKLVYLLITGIIIRFVLIPFIAHPFDSYSWFLTAEHITENPTNYSEVFPVPLWPYTLFLVDNFYNFFHTYFPIEHIYTDQLPAELHPQWNIQFIPNNLFLIFMKIPMLISDIVGMFLIFKIVKLKTQSQKLSEKAALLWFFNPLLIWISAGWGMFDSIPAVFALASMFFLIQRKAVMGGIMLSLAVLFKVYALLFIIPILFFLKKEKILTQQSPKFLISTILPIIPFALIIFGSQGFFTDFLAKNTFFGFFGYGLTYWATSFLFPNLFENAHNLMYVLMIIGISITIFVIYKLRRVEAYRYLIISQLLMILAVFLTYRIVQEQWIVWILPFLILLHINDNRRYLYHLPWIIALVLTQKNFSILSFTHV